MVKNNIALLIDAENMSFRYINKIIEKIEAYQNQEKLNEVVTKITHKIAFANWYENTTEDWSNVLKVNAITQEHSSSNSVGKNATDISLVIYTMDAVFNKDIDTFILATCDSDFTELAYKLTEYGKNVIICGNKTTSLSLKNAGSDYWEVDICQGAKLNDKPTNIKDDTIKTPTNLKHSKEKGTNKNLKHQDFHISLTSKNDVKELIKDKKELARIATYVFNRANSGSAKPDKIDMSYVYSEMQKVAIQENGKVNYKELRFKKLQPFLKSLNIFKFSKKDKQSTVTYYVELK